MDFESLSPMMKQYFKIKEQHPDSIVMYRLGDFYEMFFDDAVTASRELELTLTGRDCGKGQRAPMCGVPHHAVDNYLKRLIEKGYTVAVCEQTSDAAGEDKIVSRDVVRIVTAGTIVEDDILDATKNNYIASVYRKDGIIGLAYADISTGEFCHSQNSTDGALVWLNDQLSALTPAEIICNEDIYKLSRELSIVKMDIIPPFKCAEAFYDVIISGEAYANAFQQGAEQHSEVAAGALLGYIRTLVKRDLSWVKKERQIEFMRLDYDTRRNLELVSTIREHRTKKGTLYELLNKTSTSMGARLLRDWLLNPLCDQTEINQRLDAVEELCANSVMRASLEQLLKGVFDISRFCGKLSFGSVNPADCYRLGESLKHFKAIKSCLGISKSEGLKTVNQNIDAFEGLSTLILNTIIEKPPIVISGGGYIKQGAHSEIDMLKDISNASKVWLAELEAKERNETGIKNLKTGYNRVFGYYIEVPKSQAGDLPFRFERKQTTVNYERFVTRELKEIESKILSAEESLVDLEIRVFNELIKLIKAEGEKLAIAANSIARLDSLVSFARVACENRYNRPRISQGITALKIVDGRHPVVESVSKEEFVPNDTYLDRRKDKIMIITGPNMAGKSTYMRQTATIILLAHIGCFVPARSAEIPIFDQIFTRVGASDDLAFGQSTFMVEMSEVASILSSATDRSFMVFDEVGRGTSTLDGLSIAWAVVEYLAKGNYMAMFSTHYSELTELEGCLDGVKNYRISVREVNNTILFLRKIVRGGANKSFGVEVAEMAGIPQEVIVRARELSAKLEAEEVSRRDKATSSSMQLTMFATPQTTEIIKILNDIDVDNLSPIKAFDILVNLKEKADKVKKV